MWKESVSRKARTSPSCNSFVKGHSYLIPRYFSLFSTIFPTPPHRAYSTLEPTDMSNRIHPLDLSNDTDPQRDHPSLLFHSSPSATSSMTDFAEGISVEDRHPNDIAQSQAPLRSEASPMSPSGHGAVYSHHPVTSGLGAPRWNSNEMNQWPYRLFTTAPPTPSGGSTLPLGSFRVPPRQQDLEDLQNPSQAPPTDPTPRFVGELSRTNLQIYNNCRGNRPSLWPDIAEDIYNLQEQYGELIVLIPGLEKKPRYGCGVCSHPSMPNPVHTAPKRRWDLSPDILSHGVHQIKPWFSNCGASFPRDRDQRRHSERCQKCKPGQQPVASPAQSSVASSPALSPRLFFPLQNNLPQEPVRPRPHNNNYNLGGHPTSGNGLTQLMPASFNPYNPLPQPNDSQWARLQGVHYSHLQGPWARGHHEYRPCSGTGNAQPNHIYSPAIYGDGYADPSYRAGSHYIDFATNGRFPQAVGTAPLLYPGYPNGMGFPPALPVLREGTILGSTPPNTLPQYNTSGPHQDLGGHDGREAQGDKVRTCVIVSEKHPDNFCAAFLSLLVLSVIFWFLVRYFLYP